MGFDIAGRSNKLGADTNEGLAHAIWNPTKKAHDISMILYLQTSTCHPVPIKTL